MSAVVHLTEDVIGSPLVLACGAAPESGTFATVFRVHATCDACLRLHVLPAPKNVHFDWDSGRKT